MQEVATATLRTFVGCVVMQGNQTHNQFSVVRRTVCRDVSAAIRVLGCISLPSERRVVKVAWLPRPDVLSMEVAFSAFTGAHGVFSPLGLILHPEDPDAELMRLGAYADVWLPPSSSLERGLILTAQTMKLNYEGDTVAMP